MPRDPETGEFHVAQLPPLPASHGVMKEREPSGRVKPRRRGSVGSLSDEERAVLLRQEVARLQGVLGGALAPWATPGTVRFTLWERLKLLVGVPLQVVIFHNRGTGIRPHLEVLVRREKVEPDDPA